LRRSPRNLATVTSIPPNGDGPPFEPARPSAAPEPAWPAEPPLGAPETAAPPWPDPAQPEPPQPGTPTSTPPTGSAAWKPWSAPAALVGWFSITIVLSIFVAIAAAVMGYSLEDAPPGVNIAGTFAQDFAMIAAALIFAYMAGRPTGADFGLVRTPIGKAIGGIILVWIGFIVFSLVWKTAIGLEDPQTLPDELGIEGSTVNLVLTVVIITILAPVCEEILFRGYVFRALCNWHGVLPAAIITGLVFGAVHIGSSPIGYALPLAAFGFGLCLLYEWTGSLLPCIALHACNNAFALGIDQGWGGEIAIVIVVAVTSSLGLAALLARALNRRADAATPGLPQPAG
jgi:membrane protease YdiL (CAAX protease family)